MNKYFIFFLLALSQISFGQTFKKISFSPSNYYSAFSGAVKPVMSIMPGDTVYTESIDCNGVDKNGKKVTVGEVSNPLTGPFYVEGALEGDVLAVSILSVSFNRSYATCLEYFQERSLPASITKQFENNFNPVEWTIDMPKGFASPKGKYEHLKNFKVPVKPFLGCIGVGSDGTPISSEDAGQSGGNLDLNRITAGSTVYLPIYNKGALLYLGDGHAAQGDGEINWAALETSLQFAFTVHVIKNRKVKLEYPRIEDETYIMTVGLDATLDNALKIATKGLLDWLQEDYHLSIEEATQVMGSSLEYKIAEIVDPKVEVVAMIKKDTLKGINK